MNNNVYHQKVDLLLRLIPFIMQERVFAVHGGSAILCDRAQEEFQQFCKAVIVPLTLLYGGKLAAALSRQHPRDLFDVKYMDMPLSNVREGLIFCLLGSDRPIHESFAPQLIDQRDAMTNQFDGMSDIPFTYDEFEQTRAKLITDVQNMMTDADKNFLLSFEAAEPQWEGYEFEYFRNFPSVQWKLLNLAKLKKQNPTKLASGVKKLQNIFE